MQEPARKMNDMHISQEAQNAPMAALRERIEARELIPLEGADEVPHPVRVSLARCEDLLGLRVLVERRGGILLGECRPRGIAFARGLRPDLSPANAAAAAAAVAVPAPARLRAAAEAAPWKKS